MQPRDRQSGWGTVNNRNIFCLAQVKREKKRKEENENV